MLDERIERELTDGEPWCFWQQTKLSHERSHLVEQELGTADIYEEALPHHTEPSMRSSANGLGRTGETGSFYQLISYYLGLAVVRKL